MRIGIGYDIHRLTSGRPLVLGGVNIPHDKGLAGHSDADCLAHALADAILGALGLEDIGYFFPNTDPQWEGADSQIILAECFKKAKERGYKICNIDTAIIAEEPKVLPHLPAMKERLAQTLEIDTTQVGIKATTNEKIGSLGRAEGIAAHAVVLLELASL